MKNRNIQIDIIKGIAIFLMVWGHSPMGFGHDYLYLFHMAVFIIASGYFYSGPEKRGFKDTLIRKIRGLWLPYAIANVAFTVFAYIAWQLGWSIVDATEMSEVFFSDGLFKRLLTEVLMLNTGPFVGATWFIKNLFGVSLAFYIIDMLVRKLGKNGRLISHTVIAVVLLVAGFIGFELLPWTPVYYNIERVLISYVLYFIGWQLRDIRFLPRGGISGIILLLSSGGLLYLLTYLGSIDMVCMEITDPIFFLISAMLGWILLSEIAFYLDNFVKFLASFIAYMGRKSLHIMIWHGFVLSLISVIFSGVELPGIVYVLTASLLPLLGIFAVDRVVFFIKSKKSVDIK